MGMRRVSKGNQLVTMSKVPVFRASQFQFSVSKTVPVPAMIRVDQCSWPACLKEEKRGSPAKIVANEKNSCGKRSDW